MKKNKLTCWSRNQRPTGLLLALSALVGFTAGWNPCSALADQDSKDREQAYELVPYTGVVKGQLTVDASLTPVAAPPAKVVSDPLGKGLQLYDLAATTVTPIFYPPSSGQMVGLTTQGKGVTVTRKGGQLRLCYTLTGFFNPDNPAELLYTGAYTVLPDGTGRFEYDDEDAPVGGLGSGLIQGTARIIADPVTGNLTLDFAHVFDGDLLLAKSKEYEHHEQKEQQVRKHDHD